MHSAERQLDVLAIAEAHSAGAAAFEHLRLRGVGRRADLLLVFLIGGGAIAGAFGVSGSLGFARPVVGETTLKLLFTISAYWMSIAVVLFICSSRLGSVRSWHTKGVLDLYPQCERHAMEMIAEGKPASSIAELRMTTIRGFDQSALTYFQASSKVSRVINVCYLLIALTPLVAVISLWSLP